MATQTGSIYISETMIDIVENPTADLDFRPPRDRKKCSEATSSIWQPEIAEEAGNTGIAETITDGIEINCDNDGTNTIG